MSRNQKATMSSDPKDLVIENLRNQVEEYKKKISEHSYETFTAKIAELENQLTQKTKECQDLKATSSMGGGGGDINEYKTKIIMLQSKIRVTENKLDEALHAKEEIEAKVKRLEGKAGESEQTEILKRQLRQEMETTDRLRQQLNQASSTISPQVQEEINNLRRQLQAAQTTAQRGAAAPIGLTGGSGDVARLKNELAARDQKIAEMERQLNGPAGISAAGPMGNVRLQREINALKSQVEMLKKNEADMKRRYEDAIRKSEAKDSDEW